MRKFIAILGFLAACFMIWQITKSISSDALSMGIGIILGVLASIPTALLLMASNKKNEANMNDGRNGQMNYPNHSPPIIILTGSGQLQNQNQPQQNVIDQMPERRFYNASQITDTQRTGEQKFKIIGDEGDNW